MTRREELDALLERVEKAEGFDRELDRDIGLTLDGWKLDVVPAGDCIVTSTGDVYADHPGGMYPSFTESLDEAIALCEKMLPDCSWNIERDHYYDNGTIRYRYIGRLRTKGSPRLHVVASFATPALALLAALLRSLSSASKGDKTT